jgi:hypothetical protein
MKTLSLIASVLILSVGSQDARAGGRVINDSIMSNLDCGSLNRNTILKYVRSERFAPSFDYPLENPDEGTCWAMSRMQRLIGFLAHLQKDASKEELDAASEIFQQYRSQEIEVGGPAQNVMVPPKAFNFPKFFLDADPSEAQKKEIEAYNKKLAASLAINQASQSFNLASQIPLDLNFFRLKFGQSRQDDFASKINKSLSEGWRPMIAVFGKFQLSSGLKDGAHGVLIQSSQMVDDDMIEYEIYDPNHPRQESKLYYSKEAGFVRGLNTQYFPNEMKVILIAESERKPIENALMDYYSNACANLK